MQCPECLYICFTQTKACGSCGFKFKKAGISSKGLLRNDAFSIFSGSKSSPINQEEYVEDISVKSDNLKVMDSLEKKQEGLEYGEFLLDLSDAKQEELSNNSAAPDSNDAELAPVEFGTGSGINLEEAEIECLGLGLEPFEEVAPETDNASSMLNLAPDPTEPSLEISEEPAFKITGSVEDSAVDLNPSSLEDSKESEGLDLIPEAEEIKLEMEPRSPVLDLGDEELSADKDQGILSSPPIDLMELDFKLEIDDSEGPLTTTNSDKPKLKIEDLRLELEEDIPTDPEK